MKRAYLHIGVEKTGTTTIQSFLAENRAVLRANGFLYPSAPGDVNHVGLTLLAAENPNRLSGLLPLVDLEPGADVKAYAEQMLLDLATEAKSSGCETLVLSNEHLSSRLRAPRAIAAVRDAVLGIAETVDVVVYVRRQDEAVLSEYSTRVKAGYSERFALERTHLVKYSYSDLLDRWAGVFGPEHILVRLFDKQAFHGGDLLTDFLRVIHCPEDAAFIRVPPQNVSLDALCLEYLRRLNRYLPAAIDGHRNKARGNIVAQLSAISTGEKPRISSEEARSILDRFEESNRDVAIRYLGRQNGQLFEISTDSSVESNLSAFDEDEDMAFKISASLWRRMRRNQ